jgi:hypothetical protein
MELIIVIFWLILAIIVGAAANARGRSGAGWFILAVVVSPLIAVLMLLAFPVRDKREVQTPKGYLPWHGYFTPRPPPRTKPVDPRWANLRSTPIEPPHSTASQSEQKPLVHKHEIIASVTLFGIFVLIIGALWVALASGALR